MDIAADLALFYADFGTAATLTPAAGGAASVPHLVLITRAPAGTLGGEFVMTAPTIQYIAADFPAAKTHDVFTIGAESWRITEQPQPVEDGLEYIAAVTRIA